MGHNSRQCFRVIPLPGIRRCGVSKKGNKKSKLALKQHEIKRIRGVMEKNFVESQEMNFQNSFFGEKIMNGSP